MFIVVGGNGRQGRAIVHYLVETLTVPIVHVIDPSPTDQPVHDIITWHKEEFSPKLLHQIVSLFSYREEVVVINCLEPAFAPHVLEISLKHYCHYVDMGGDTDTTFQLMEIAEEIEAEKSGLTVIPDCGLAPGIVSSLAGELERKRYRQVWLYCGGIPKDKTRGYLRSFSGEGLAREYSGDMVGRCRGELRKLPALSKTGTLDVPEIGLLEYFPTSGGLSISPYISDLQYLSYQTLRWPGHCEEVKDTRDLETSGIFDHFQECLEADYPTVSKERPDQIILQVCGCSAAPITTTTWRVDYNFSYNLSAMEQGTGFVVAEVANRIHDRKIRPGFVPMHDLDGFDIINTIPEFERVG